MAGVEKLITEHIDVWTSAIKKRNATGRGSNKKIELTGIKKLRGLILQLAVMGKLVQQNPADEPASVLLEKIAEEKAQLIADKKIKKQKPLPAITDEEKPFELPIGWAFERIGTFGNVGTGSTPSRSNPDYWQPAEFNWVSSGETSDFFVNETKEKVSVLAIRETNVSLYPAGTLIVAMYGQGKTRGQITELLSEAGTNQACAAIRLVNDSMHHKDYVKLFFRKAYNELRSHAAGGAQPNLNVGKISNTILALPPLAEQKRIVAKVDELMALCDQLEQQTEQSLTAHQTLVEVLLASLTSDTLTDGDNKEDFQTSWQRIAEHFDVLFTTEASIEHLKQTILQLAVMGKLVPQNPNDEPASVLLEKIAEEKAQLIADKKIKKQKPLPAITDDEKPFESPSSWECSRMGDLAQYQKGFAFKSKDYLDSGLMITKIQNLTDNHTENSVYITPERTTEFEPFVLHEGDIVMTTVGSWFSAPMSAVGRSFLINSQFDNSLLNQNAVRIRTQKELVPMYLYLCVNSSLFKNYLVKEAQGTANQASITQVSIKNYVIFVPPLAEQHRIVAKVDELMTFCDQLKVSLADAQTTQLHLADAAVENALTYSGYEI